MATALLHYAVMLLALMSCTFASSQILQSFESESGVNDLSGCGKSHTEGYVPSTNSANTITVGGRPRTFGVYVPTGYNLSPSTPRKLIFDYHGNDGTPEQQHLNSRYFANTDGQKYIVVYPAGVGQSWESAPYATPGVSDLNFTTNLLAYVRSQYCIDSNHVYASGKSNGGGFVDYLACSTNGSEFAAFAMASAALYADNAVDQCATNRTRAILESHGGSDGTIDYGGHTRKSDGGQTPNVRSWIGWWQERDCRGSMANSTTDGLFVAGYEQITFSCYGYDELVQHYDIYALGHCWPSIDGSNWDSRRSYCRGNGTQVLDFTSAVVKFFAKWNVTMFNGES